MNPQGSCSAGMILIPEDTWIFVPGMASTLDTCKRRPDAHAESLPISHHSMLFGEGTDSDMIQTRLLETKVID